MPYIVVDDLYNCMVINDPKTYINECCRVGHTIFTLLAIYIYIVVLHFSYYILENTLQ